LTLAATRAADRVASAMFGGSEKKESSEISYARSRMLNMYSFFGVSKKDAAVIWSAFDLIDKHKNETVHIKDFAKMFCPNSHLLFEKMYDKYCFVPKEKAFKTAQQGNQANDETQGMDADELMAYMKKGQAEQAAAKAKFDREMHLKREKELHARHRPDYVKFMCFFLFFMSIPDEDMPLWVFWLWHSLPKVRVTKESVHSLVGQIWSDDNFNKSWYDGEVRYIVKVVDPSFNARTFQLTDQRCGGAWTIPFHELRKELYRNFDSLTYFDRLKVGFDHAMINVEASLRRMKDLRLKGAPADHTDKGDRGDARHDVRAFVQHYRNYAFMPMDEEETFAEGNMCATLGTMVRLGLKRLFQPCLTCWEKVGPKEIDVTMGMGSEGYVRPSSRGLLSKLKKELEIKEGRVPAELKKKLTAEESEAEELAQLEEEAEAERKRLVPLEYKYRKQLELPARVLNHKAVQMRAEGLLLVRRVQTEVTIMEDIEVNEFGTEVNIDPIDDNESEDGGIASSLNTREDDESASYGSR